MSNKSIYLKIIMDFVIAGMIIIFAIFFFPRIIFYFLPFIVGGIISLAANPMVRFMEKRTKIMRRQGSALCILFAIAIVIGIIYLGITFAGRQIIQIINDAPEILENFSSNVEMIISKYQSFYNKLPVFLQEYIDELRGEIGNQNVLIQDDRTDKIGLAKIAFKNVINIFVFFLFTILSAYFFTADKEKIEKKVKEIIPECMHRQSSMLVKNLKLAIGGYFKAQVQIMLILTIIMYVAFKILNIRYAFLMAIGIGILDFLPVFGAGIILLPWAIYEILIKEYYLAIGIVILYILLQVVRQIIEPKIVGKSIGVSSFTTFFLMYLGYKIGGIFGIIVAVPAGMVIITLAKNGIFDDYRDDIKYVLSNIEVFRRENADEIGSILKKRKNMDKGER